MIPLLKQKIEELNNAGQAKEPQMINAGKEGAQNKCKECKQQLVVPFYLDPATEEYICSYCELKDTEG